VTKQPAQVPVGRESRETERSGKQRAGVRAVTRANNSAIKPRQPTRVWQGAFRFSSLGSSRATTPRAKCTAYKKVAAMKRFLGRPEKNKAGMYMQKGGKSAINTKCKGESHKK